MSARVGSVLVYDSTDRLTPFWRLGTLISRADRVIAARSWAHAYEELATLPGPIHTLQVWGHGSQGRPAIAGGPVDLERLAGSVDIRGWLWWRSCSVAEGSSGQSFMRRCTLVLDCDVVGHCDVISAPNPLWQRQICGLRRGQSPWWSASGDELRGCLTTRMTPPAHAWRP